MTVDSDSSAAGEVVFEMFEELIEERLVGWDAAVWYREIDEE